MLSHWRMLAKVLWACSILSVLGVILSLWSQYRDLLGVVKTPTDLLLRSGPGLISVALHALSAQRVTASRRARHPIVRVCGVCDVVVGASMLVPWVGLWTSLLSPFGVLFLVAAVHAPAPMGSVAYLTSGAATVGMGVLILRVWREDAGKRANENQYPEAAARGPEARTESNQEAGR